MPLSDVQSFYDATVEAETRRLDDSWLEHAVTHAWLDKYLTPASDVLDLGGGPGRYAIELARLGHSVTLADLSAANVEAARKSAAQHGVILQDALQIDARDLSLFPDAHFDMVMCLGPIYHQIDDADRAKTLAEVFRVLRPGGIAFIGFLSRFAPLHYLAKLTPEDAPDQSATHEEILATGILKPNIGNRFFTEARFDLPDAIPEIVQSAGFRALHLIGAEGGFAQSEIRLKALSTAAKSAWLKRAVDLSDSPFGLYGSEHLIAICERPDTGQI